MSCIDCSAAAEKAWHSFTADCHGCCARAASRSPHYRRVRGAGKLDARYLGLLQQFGLTHAQVKEAARIDASSKVAA